VQINGSSHPTTFISSTQLVSSLTVADQPLQVVSL
jgi:hypothetical protein